MGILLKPKPPTERRMTTQEYFALGPTKDSHAGADHRRGTHQGLAWNREVTRVM
jgi:hypothetical protein